MTPASLLAPIAAAAMANMFLFALFWRGGQLSRKGGELPWWTIAGIIAYGLAVGYFLYFKGSSPIQGYADVFMAAVAAEMLAAAMVYTALSAVWFTRGRPLRERVFPALICLVFAITMGMALLSKPYP